MEGPGMSSKMMKANDRNTGDIGKYGFDQYT